MAKLFNRLIERFGIKNAAAPAPSSGGSAGVAINRDPKTTQVKRIGYQISNAAGGGSGREILETPKTDFNVIQTACERDSYLMQSMMKYSELIFKSGFNYRTKNDQALQYLRLRLNMMQVATLVPTEALYQGIADDIVKYSNSFLVKARAKGGKGLPPGIPAIAMPPAKDPVAGYFRLAPYTMTVRRDINGNVIGYRQTLQGAGDPIDFRAEDVVHIKVNVPVGEAFGMPWVTPVLDDIRLLRKVEENAALLLYRHIFPLLSYTVGTDKPGFEASNEELEELRATVESMPTDGAIVLPERHKIEAVQVTAIDGKPYLEYFENRVFSGLGMSQVDFGRGNTANRNTADAMSGNKADRVKGWQHQIQMQIDKSIIEEILVEGGFDPMVNPDFDVDFVFNEIEQEMRIKMDTHEIFKFEHNLQTWEETRKGMSLDPLADEARLYFQMIGMQQAAHQAALDQQSAAAAGSAATNNKQQPTNQHGKRSGPKKQTQSTQEAAYKRRYPAPQEVNYHPRWDVEFESTHESVGRISQKFDFSRVDELVTNLESVYIQMEEDVVGEIAKYSQRSTSESSNIKTMISSIHFGKDRMENFIQKSARPVLLEGAKKAAEEMKLSKTPAINTPMALRTINETGRDSFNKIEETIYKQLADRLDGMDDTVGMILIARSTFAALNHRLRAIAKTTMLKTYHYGYVLAMSKAGVEQLRVEHDGGCSMCLELSEEPITLVSLSSYDESAIYTRIPPFHTNCECDLVLEREGGES